MKTQLRSYIRAVLLSAAAALLLDALINFDDIQRAFHAGSHAVPETSQLADQAQRLYPDQLARYSGILFQMIAH